MPFFSLALPFRLLDAEIVPLQFRSLCIQEAQQ